MADAIPATFGGKSYDLKLAPVRHDPLGLRFPDPRYPAPLDDIASVAARLRTDDDWLESDVRRVIFWAVVGGGYGHKAAGEVCDRIGDEPLHVAKFLALQIVAAYVIGIRLEAGAGG